MTPAPYPAGLEAGLACLRSGRSAEAAMLFAEATRQAPSHAGCRTNLGVALTALGRHEEAAACFQAAAVLEPFSPSAQDNLGRILAELGRQEEAEQCFRRACALAPDDQHLQLRLAHALIAQGRYAEAESSYRLALEQNGAVPGLADADRADALNNLGNALRRLDRLAEAVRCYEQAVALVPTVATVWANLGNALLQVRALRRAERCFRTAIALDADHADAQGGLAVCLLTRGALPEGFAAFEHRWRMPQMRDHARRLPQPIWRGESARGRTLLIHAEQGQGDTLQFCRYAVLAARRGFTVVLEVQRSLVRLLQHLPEVAQVVARGQKLPPFDLHCPMLSLPLVFGTTLETIPACSFLPPARARRRRGILQVGLAWAGNPYHDKPDLAAVDRRRSIDPALLAPLLALPGIRFTSLQKGDAAPWSDTRLADPMAAVTDFADTAYLIDGLDLVIAVDSAVAHLAAGLGRPVWLLDRFDSCWRWLEGRGDSPWYPSLRLYRQKRPGDWAGVLRRVARDLRRTATS